MAIPRPNQLRYAQCELPNGMEQLIDVFIDDFYNDIRAIDLDLEDYNLNVAPGIIEALKAQIELRKQLLEGSSIPELADLQALHDNLFLTNPELSEEDPIVISQKERKLGAVGIVLLNGVIYANNSKPASASITTTDRQVGDLEPFRRLWAAVGGNYEAFLQMGDAIASSPAGSFTLLQYVAGKGKVPYINKTFEELAAKSPFVALNKYNQDLIWTGNITNGVSSHKKLTDIGYSDTQISSIFAGKHPRADELQIRSTIEQSVGSMMAFTSLVYLPLTDTRRQPRWVNEVAEFTNALTFYLRYREQKNLSSSVFDTDLWGRIKAVLKKGDLKELFENRPEVTSMQIPTDEITLGNLLNKAAEVPLGSTLFSSYMLKIPLSGRDAAYEVKLYDVGIHFLQALGTDNSILAVNIQLLLEQLIGAAVVIPATIVSGAVPVKTITTSPPVKLGAVTPPDPALANSAANATNAGTDAVPPDQAPTNQEGLEEAGNAMSTLLMKWKAAENFVSCSKSTKQDKSAGAQTDAVTKYNKISKDLGVQAGAKGGSPDPKALYGVNGKELLSNPKNLQSTNPKSNTTLSRNGSTVFNNSVVTIQKTPVTITDQSGKTTNAILSTEGIEVGNTISGNGIADGTKVVSIQGATQITISKPAIATASGSYSFVQIGENLDNISTPEKAQITSSQGASNNSISTKFEYTCTPTFENEFTKFLVEKGHLLSAHIKAACEALKRAIFLVQNIVDNLIAKAQVILDQVLGLLERLLTLDLNIGGSLGLDTSLIKCSWSLDFGIKIDLFGLLLKFLNEFFTTFGAPLRAGIAKIQDILTKVICVPIRLLEFFLGGVNALLNLIGCSLKDIELPTEILDLIKALLFSFDLRGLVLRKGYDAFNGITANFGKGKDSFNGLTQFAALCQKVTMRDALNAIDGTLLAAAVTAPTAAADAIGQSASFLKKKSIGAAIGATL